jgi:formamidopyrimidine-DNA glycosylase
LEAIEYDEYDSNLFQEASDIMPELPDVTVYIEALTARILGNVLQDVRIVSPFLLRTFEPPHESVNNRRVTAVKRFGKRIAIGLDGDLWLVIHLMIAGRFQWKAAGAKVTGKIGLAAFDFTSGTLLLTEAGSKRRASMHIFQGLDQVRQHAPEALDVMSCSVDEFKTVLTSENHTLKRSLTDPSLFSRIGNAYSDEILHRARLSPIMLTNKLTAEEITRLHQATAETLRLWIERLRHAAGVDFPTHVTAFHDEMSVHGRFGKPCPDCGCPVQRIRYAENENNYCDKCQTGGRVLADRSLSRLLKDDWPRSLDEWS